MDVCQSVPGDGDTAVYRLAWRGDLSGDLSSVVLTQEEVLTKTDRSTVAISEGGSSPAYA